MAAAGLAGLAASGSAGAQNRPVSWPHWEAYKAHFLNAEGRVVDYSASDHTTTEGQAYGLFFALVANDRVTFERLLRWTEENLGSKDLTHLPSWLYGHDDAWKWHVLDPNSASDADLWMSYVLLEAGRLWNEPRYDRLGRALAELIARNEVTTLPDLGPMLLPGPTGFALADDAWRLNPSYVPPQLLRRLAAAIPGGPWRGIAASSLRMLREGVRNGAVPDWIRYRKAGGFDADPVTGAVGSYDAIRVYLWLGMLDPGDAWRQGLGPITSTMLRYWTTHASLPVRLNTAQPNNGSGTAPPGFLSAVLVEAQARGDAATLGAVDGALGRTLTAGLYGMPPAYYDQNLILFARGYTTGQFRFLPDGSLCPGWKEGCH
jgi:endoglucanase